MKYQRSTLKVTLAFFCPMFKGTVNREFFCNSHNHSLGNYFSRKYFILRQGNI